MRRRSRAMLTGAVLGGSLAALGLLAARAFTPSLHAASVFLIVPMPAGLVEDSTEPLRLVQRQVRDTLARRISNPELLPRIVLEQGVPNAVAAEFSRSLRAVATRDRPSFVSLSAQAHDPQALAGLLDATVDAVLLADARRALLVQDDQIQALAELDAQVIEQDQIAQAALADVDLPVWARASATAMGLLDARKFAASLAPYLGRPATAFETLEMARTQGEIDALMLQIGGTPAITSEQFAAARQRASTAARRAHLARARQSILEREPTEDVLQVVQYAQPVAVPPPPRRLLWISLIGSSLGALTGFLRFAGRPERRKTDGRDGPTLETHLHVRVLGMMAAALTDYGERKLRPLAQTHPDHLAVEGVRSLGTALDVLRTTAEHSGPIIMANADEQQYAGHVLANLAMLAAERDERVLLIDTEGQDSVLSGMFTTGTRTFLSTAVDAEDLANVLPKGKSGGRIRFVVADEQAGTDPPVPGAFASYFDRIYIRAHSIARATELAACYDECTGVLVAHHSLAIRDWQRARDEWREGSDALVGLVQCGHNIDEQNYQSDPA